MDMIGQEFGELTVVAPAGRSKQNRLLWVCRCKCGNRIIVRSDGLRSGRSRSCGHCHQLKIIPGMKFGRWITIEDAGSDVKRNRLWRVRCTCPEQNEKLVTAANLRNGKSQSCGCLQKEKATKTIQRFNAKAKSKYGRVYTAWLNFKSLFRRKKGPPG